MNSNYKKPIRIQSNNLLFVIFYILLLIAFIIIGTEIILRYKGVKLWGEYDIPIKVNPGGKFFTKHPTLGYSHISGSFTVTLDDGYSFKVTHLPNTLRITHPLNTYKQGKPKEEIWIFGCSFTHGWSLNDQETFPWLLQQRFQNYEVINFGVSGYGTVHSLIQFREALENGHTPKIVLLAYSAVMHDTRNAFLRSRRKAVAPWNKLGLLVHPYARLDSNGKLSYHLDKVEYRPFPFMKYSAIANFIETFYNKVEHRIYHTHDISKALILEFAKAANNRRIAFIVAGLDYNSRTHDMPLFAQQNGFKYVDISVDLANKNNINFPHDSHPSASANKKYADKIEAFLRTERFK